jgi:ABC-2 type transport system permease protein
MNELLKLFARKRTYVGFIGSIVAELLFLSLGRLPLARRALEKSFQRFMPEELVHFADYYQGLTMALLAVTFTFLMLGGLYLALVCGDIMAKEVEDGTMRMILARPISRLRLWLLKWLASSFYTFTLVIFIGLTSLLLATAFYGGLGKLAVVYGQHPRNLMLVAIYETTDGLCQYARGIVLLAIVMHVVSALAFMFSCLNMKPATATISTLAIFFLDAVLKMVPFFSVFEKWFLSYHLACWLRAFSRYLPTIDIVTSVLYLLCLSAVLLGVSAYRFCRRDFKP